jgi:hypothetical protein
MTVEEKKAKMARDYAINSKKTPRTKRMAFAREHSTCFLYYGVCFAGMEP